MTQPELTSEERHVLEALARVAGEHGQADLEAVAKEAGLHPEHVRAMLLSLLAGVYIAGEGDLPGPAPARYALTAKARMLLSPGPDEESDSE